MKVLPRRSEWPFAGVERKVPRPAMAYFPPRRCPWWFRAYKSGHVDAVTQITNLPSMSDAVELPHALDKGAAFPNDRSGAAVFLFESISDMADLSTIEFAEELEQFESGVPLIHS